MKTFILLLAVAFAKADPQLFYGQQAWGYQQYAAPLGFAAYGASPFYKAIVPMKAEMKDEMKAEEMMVETYAQPKEMKMAEEAAVKVEYKPYMTPYGANAFATPYAYATPYATPFAYKVLPRYQAKNGEVEHTVYKREAEADAQFLYNGFYPYTSTYAAAPAVAPYFYNAVAPTKYVFPTQYAVPAVEAIKYDTKDKVVANDALSPFGYAAKGQYVADSKGAIHIAKREAEAEPQLIAGGLWAYNTLPYNTPYVYGAQAYAYNPYVTGAQAYAYSPYAYQY